MIPSVSFYLEHNCNLIFPVSYLCQFPLAYGISYWFLYFIDRFPAEGWLFFQGTLSPNPPIKTGGLNIANSVESDIEHEPINQCIFVIFYQFILDIEKMC